MTPTKRLRFGALALTFAVSLAQGAAADAPQPLTPDDAQRYAAAFEAVDRGDFIDAEMKAAEIRDKSLAGYLSFRQLMHPTAHKASFHELAAWLGRFRDLPLAEKIFSLAARRDPAKASTLPVPEAPALARAAPAAASKGESRPAREAFYSGDVRRAQALAQAGGDHWIAGMSAFRLKDFAPAQASLTRVAADETVDPWLRAAGAFWAARATAELGDPSAARTLLRLAAQAPETFYGMIAERQLTLSAAQAAPSLLVKASWRAPDPQAQAFAAANPRAHRAAALAQIGKLDEARQEVRVGQALARTDADRAGWQVMAQALGAGAPSLPTTLSPRARYVSVGDHPTPDLQPKWGFTLEKALVYAIVRQESRFDPLARSHAGAVGLMQLMPEAAARAAGDDKLKADMSPLLDPAFNLRVGQDYVTWLMERGVGYDILRTVAAYNGGPGTLAKTVGMLGDETDSLMVIECLPSLESRNYVEKVMAAYWTYRKMWGQPSPTLDALATGAKFVDARLDLTQPGGVGTQLSAQTLQIGATLLGGADAPGPTSVE